LSTAQKKNAEYTKQITQFKQQITSSENMIKMQDNDIARLKYVISEAESEK
jgi:ribosomal protein L29